MIPGLDLSGDFQTVDSFHSVRDAGYRFVVVKATEGQSFKAGNFADYQHRIRSVEGLTFGAYHFLRSDVDGKAQAEHFLSVYDPAPGDLPPMIDVEEFSAGKDAATKALADFNTVVEQTLKGRKVLLYTYYAAIEAQSFDTGSFSGHKLWMAQYSNVMASPPQTWAAPTFWQHADNLQVPGIKELCDGDQFLGSNDDFEALKLGAGDAAL